MKKREKINKIPKSVTPEKQAYYYRKETVLEREQDNDKMVILFRSDKNWWKMMERSVLYYTNLIAPRLNRKVNIIPDSDYALRARIGAVMIKDIDTLMRRAKEELGLELEHEDDPNYRAIRLRNRVSQEELQRMLNDEKWKKENSERMLIPAVIWPKIYQKTLMLIRETTAAVRKLEAPSQRAIGDPMTEVAVDIILAINSAAHSEVSNKEGLKRIVEDLNVYDGYLLAVMGASIMMSEKILQLSTISMDIRELANREMEKLMKKENRREAEKGVEAPVEETKEGEALKERKAEDGEKTEAGVERMVAEDDVPGVSGSKKK